MLQVSVGFGPGVIAAPVFSLADPAAPPVVLLPAAGAAGPVARQQGP
ncbi:hypothetical protein ACFY3N_26380 [Streptomyces sp. NPDC000348]